MSRLLIWDGIDHRPGALLQELATNRSLSFTWTTDAAGFEAAAGAGGHDYALVFVRGTPTEAQVEPIRRVAAQLATAGLLLNPGPDGMRALLALGAREVFVEPIAPGRLVAAVLARMQRAPVQTSQVLHPVDPIECGLRVFGSVVDEVPGRWLAVAPGMFEVSTSAHLDDDALIEVIGVPEAVRTVAGTFGRVVRVDTKPGAPSRIRCEAMPVGDKAPISLDSQSGREPRVVAVPRREPIRLDPAILGGLVALLLFAAGMGWMATTRVTVVTQAAPATTRQVLEGIQRAFE